MSKYAPLWERIGKHTEDSFTLTYAAIEAILGFPIDHSFLNFNKELLAYGYEVGKISMKAQTVAFRRCTTLESEYNDADVLFFFDDRPDALPLYMELTDLIKKALPAFTVKVQKSQIGFYNRHLFAMVSLPRRKPESGIVVSFRLGNQLDSPRVAVATEPYPNRWTAPCAGDGDGAAGRGTVGLAAGGLRLFRKEATLIHLTSGGASAIISLTHP